MLYTLDTMTDGFAKEDGRGKAGGHNKTSEDIINEAKTRFRGFTCVPCTFIVSFKVLLLHLNIFSVNNLHFAFIVGF